MTTWWGRSVAACSSVAVLAGMVALVSAAVDADSDAVSLSAERGAAPGEETAAPPSPAAAAVPAATTLPGPPPARPGAPVAPGGLPREGDAAADVAVPAGWRSVATQRVVPVQPGRFDTVLALGDRAVVMVGRLAPQTPRAAPADPGVLRDEARRLVGAFADGLAPGTTPADLRDGADTVDGRRAWTTLRGVEGGGARVDGGLVRVTTVTGPDGGGIVALAVALPGRTQAADAAAADTVVRSLRVAPAVRPVSAPAARPVPPGRPVPQSRPVPPGRPQPAPSVPPRPGPPPPAPPAPTGR